MTEAWQVRSYKQQEFVGELVREVRVRADETACEVYIAEFLIALIRYIAAAHGNDLAIAPTDSSRQFAEMVPRIERFCRVDSERGYIAHRLFQGLESALSSWAQRGYLSDQIDQPKNVFGAPSAMSEIDG